MPVGVLSRKIAAKFRDALKKQKPDLFADIPAVAWRREWVSFLKHYGHGNDAVLNYLSRYVFRTAISNAGFSPWTKHTLLFRYKDRGSGHLALHAPQGRRVSAAILAARPATRFSQGPILWDFGMPRSVTWQVAGVAPLNSPEAKRHGLPAEDRRPARSVGPTCGTRRTLSLTVRNLTTPTRLAHHCGSTCTSLLAQCPNFGEP